MTNSQLAPLHIDNESGHQGENNNMAPGNVGPPTDPIGISLADPIDVNSHVAIDTNLPPDPKNSIRGEGRLAARNTQNNKEDGINLQMIFEMLQAQ